MRKIEFVETVIARSAQYRLIYNTLKYKWIVPNFFSAFFFFQFDQKRVFYLSSLFLLLLVDAFLLFLCVIAKSVCIKSMSRFQWQKIATKEIFCFIQWIWWLEICTIILTFGYKLPKNTLADLKKDEYVKIC